MKTITVQNIKAAAMPLLAEKEASELLFVAEGNLAKTDFIVVRRNVDIKNPKFVRDEFRILYYLCIYLNPEKFGTGRYGNCTCTKAQTKARQRLFAMINDEGFTMSLASRWLQSALLKANAGRVAA